MVAGEEQQRLLVGHCVVESVNTWAEFARGYYLSSVYGARDVTGARVTTVLGPGVSEPLAIDTLMQSVRPSQWTRSPGGPWKRRDEPPWHEPPTLLKGLEGSGASNIDKVRAAFAIDADAFQDLPPCRNFFAHRGRYTAWGVRSVLMRYGITGEMHPADAVRRAALARPQPVLADWLDEIGTVISLMA